MRTDLLSPLEYVIPFLIAMAVALGCTWLVRRYALAKGIVDRPDSAPERKIQARPTPLLGGVAILVAVTLVTVGYALFTDRVIGGYLAGKHLYGLLLGGLVLMVGGYLDDRYGRKPGQQIVWPVVAALVVIASGIGIDYVTNPIGGVIQLDTINFKLFTVGGVPYFVTLLADAFAFLWLMGMMYTTKFLDGLDGLVSGVTTIAAIVIFFLSIMPDVAQPETALLAVILAGASLGFLVFNFHPAKIFLGEGGSLLTGFMLGVLSIISGGKIATALLIMGLPILDVVWVLVRRLLIERKSPFSGDQLHLHFRLLRRGLSQRQVVLFLYAVSAAFGVSALLLPGRSKLITLAIFATVVVLGNLLQTKRDRRSLPNSPTNVPH